MSAALDAVEAIVDAVAAAVGGQAGIPADVLRSASRVPAVMRARDLMMRILHTDFLCTVDAVGLAMGCDRTTVSFGERRCQERLRTDPALEAQRAALVAALKAAGVVPPPQRIGVLAIWRQLRISLPKAALHAVGVQQGDRVDATPLDDQWRAVRIRRGERFAVTRITTGMPGVAVTLPPHLCGMDSQAVPATWVPIVGGGIDVEMHRCLSEARDRQDRELFEAPTDACEGWASYAGHDCPRAVAQCRTDLRRTFGSVAG